MYASSDLEALGAIDIKATYKNEAARLRALARSQADKERNARKRDLPRITEQRDFSLPLPDPFDLGPPWKEYPDSPDVTSYKDYHLPT